MTQLLNLPDQRLANSALSFGFFEDFLEFVSGDIFTDTSADSGASWAAQDERGGSVLGITGGTNNNEAYLLTTKELFLFTAGKPMIFEIRAKVPDVNTDDANYAFGFKNAVAADTIVDDGAGPSTSGSGALFYKNDSLPSGNATTFYATTFVNSVVADNAPLLLSTTGSLDKTAVQTGTGYQTFRIEVIPQTSVYHKVNFLVDRNGGSNLSLVASFRQAFASSTEMQAFFGVKTGSANDLQPTVDYIGAYQVR